MYNRGVRSLSVATKITSMALVKINGEEFSITEIPPSDSQLVLKQKAILLGSIDLPTLVTDLGRVGKFVRVAYNGVAGHTDLQIEIREIGVNVTKLCDKSAVTVSRFKTASNNVLARLKSTYGFLTGGFEKMALVTMKAVAEVAKDMATAADELHSDFNAESERVEKALGSTMKAKGKEEVKKKEIAEEEKKLEAQKAKAREEKAIAEEEFEKAEKKHDDAVKQEIECERSAHSGINAIKQLVNGFAGVELFDTEGDKIEAEKMRQIQIQKLEEMSKLRQERSKALQDIADFTTRLAQCKDDTELTNAAIGALHSAMGGLQKLSAVMMKAALFWKQVQVHCEQLAQERMQELIATALEMPKSDRLEFWKDPYFLQEAVEYYGQWVALDDVCGTYMDEIKVTQKDLYSYLTENPTNEQARENVRDLASQFGIELKDEQEKIKEKEFASAEEVAKLQAQSIPGK